MDIVMLWDWLSDSILTTAPVVTIIGFLALLFRNAVSEAVIGRVRQPLEIQLKELQSRLDAQESTNSDLRAFVLSGAAIRRSRLVDREAEALDKLWRATSALSAATFQIKMLDTINYEEAAKHAAIDAETREFFGAIGKSFDIENAMEKLKDLDPQAQRPYVNDLTWALYSAFSGIIANYLMKQKVLEHGAPPQIIKSDNHLKELVLAALPYQKAIFDEHPKVWFSIFLEILQKELLSEIRKSLSGAKDTDSDVKRANDIIAALDAFQLSQASHQTEP